MMTWSLIALHIIMVTAVYWTAYRTGYHARFTDTRRHAKDQAASLTEMLEDLNLDVDEFLDDKRPDD